ncbi:hypothetical protein [Halomonas sp. E19]|uniref:hypothetical protein n=1 Tax=Halomonas sp. E19 TaxID=3397247 RepID=UPI00403479F4
MSASPPPQEALSLDPVKPVRPQLLVALGGRSEEDAALVRAAHRHAQREESPGGRCMSTTAVQAPDSGWRWIRPWRW